MTPTNTTPATAPTTATMKSSPMVKLLIGIFSGFIIIVLLFIMYFNYEASHKVYDLRYAEVGHKEKIIIPPLGAHAKIRMRTEKFFYIIEEDKIDRILSVTDDEDRECQYENNSFGTGKRPRMNTQYWYCTNDTPDPIELTVTIVGKL